MESIERTGACLLAKQAESTKNGRLKWDAAGDPCVKRKYFFASSRQRDELDMFIPAGDTRARAGFFSRNQKCLPKRALRSAILQIYVFVFALRGTATWKVRRLEEGGEIKSRATRDESARYVSLPRADGCAPRVNAPMREKLTEGKMYVFFFSRNRGISTGKCRRRGDRRREWNWTPGLACVRAVAARAARVKYNRVH